MLISCNLCAKAKIAKLHVLLVDDENIFSLHVTMNISEMVLNVQWKEERNIHGQELLSWWLLSSAQTLSPYAEWLMLIVWKFFVPSPRCRRHSVRFYSRARLPRWTPSRDGPYRMSRPPRTAAECRDVGRIPMSLPHVKAYGDFSHPSVIDRRFWWRLCLFVQTGNVMYFYSNKSHPQLTDLQQPTFCQQMHGFFHPRKVASANVAAELVETDALLERNFMRELWVVQRLQELLIGRRCRFRFSVLFLVGILRYFLQSHFHRGSGWWGEVFGDFGWSPIAVEVQVWLMRIFRHHSTEAFSDFSFFFFHSRALLCIYVILLRPTHSSNSEIYKFMHYLFHFRSLFSSLSLFGVVRWALVRLLDVCSITFPPQVTSRVR